MLLSLNFLGKLITKVVFPTLLKIDMHIANTVKCTKVKKTSPCNQTQGSNSHFKLCILQCESTLLRKKTVQKEQKFKAKEQHLCESDNCLCRKYMNLLTNITKQY